MQVFGLCDWEEIVAQVAALLYLRAEANPEVDELQAINDHKSILQSYKVKDPELIKHENRRINLRVEEQCVQAIQILRQRLEARSKENAS